MVTTNVLRDCNWSNHTSLNVWASHQSGTRVKCSARARARCAGRTVLGVRAQAVAYIVKRVSWDSDVLPHATVNMACGVSSGRMDVLEPIQVTPYDEILPTILIKQINLGHFGRSHRDVLSSGAVAHSTSTSPIGHTIKLEFIVLNRRSLADASASDGHGEK